MNNKAPICHVCNDTLSPTHRAEDCPTWDKYSDPRARRTGCSMIIAAAFVSWAVIFLLIYFLQTSGILDAIDNWKAPWQ